MQRGPLADIVRQAQKMQSKMEEVQNELANKTIEANSGGGMVVAVVNGNKELVALRLEAEVVDPQDIAMLQDLIIAAVNQGMKQASEMAEEEMGKVTGGLKIPGLF